MKVFVVTPYFNTPPDWLIQCHRSVRAQTAPATHIMVCDGCLPIPVPGFEGIHVVLRKNYADFGTTPRMLGIYQAVAEGADAIAFLDADCWFYPRHIAAMLAHMQAASLDAACSARILHRLDGSTMIRCPDVDGDAIVDTNCLMVLRPTFPHLLGWVLKQPPFDLADNAIWRHLRAHGMRTGFLDQATVAYRTRHAVHYLAADEPPPPGAVVRENAREVLYE